MVSLIHKAWVIIVLTTGYVLLIAGGLMLILPGPGWLAIIAGLGLLATHYLWAKNILRRIKSQVKKGKDWFKK